MNVLEFIGSYWWLVFPIGGALGGTINSLARNARSWDERRRQDKIELARIKYGARAAAAEQAKITQSEIDRTLARHQAANKRWLDYELDVAKLIDYPLMTDMREPLTLDFHRAKRDADALREGLAHVGHERVVDELGDVELVVQPPLVGGLVAGERSIDLALRDWPAAPPPRRGQLDPGELDLVLPRRSLQLRALRARELMVPPSAPPDGNTSHQ